jgi:hypothetical protein
VVRGIVGAALALSLTATPAHGAPPGAIDGGACIAFDAHGYRYIAFGRTGVAEPGIYLATNRSGTWRLSPHPIAVGARCAAMTVDAARHVHLLAVNPLTEDPVSPVELWYVTDRSGSWRASRLYGGEIGFASVEIDRTGLANVALRDQEVAFLYERSTSGGWVRRRDFAYAHISHLRKDPSGSLWVVVDYFDRPRVVRLTDRPGSWTAATVRIPLPAGANVDIAIDASGQRSIAVHDGTTGDVRIYRDLAGSWSRIGHTSAPAGRFMAEADNEPAGAMHLMFWWRRSATSVGIVDMNRHDGVWHTQLIGYASSFRADLAIDGRGRVGAVFERDGVVWSYWNNWSGTPHRFRVSDL